MDNPGKQVNRMASRKQRTRAALIEAAQNFIADGQFNASMQEISKAANVGVGSFYNHFESKDQLYQDAVNEILDTQGALLDALTDSIEDPAEKFAARYRLTGRLVRLRPKNARVVLNVGISLMMSERGLAPRGIRDIGAAITAGRFEARDPELAMVIAAGTLTGLAHLLLSRPERDGAQTTDEFTEALLRMFGMGADEAHRLCQTPLPDFAWLDEAEPSGGEVPKI